MTERIRRNGRWFFEEAALAYSVEYHRATVESVRDECAVYQFRALGRRPRLYRSRRWTVLQVLWHYTGQYCEYIAWPRSTLFPFTLGLPLSPISRAGARYIFMYTTWEDVKRQDVRRQEWKSTKIKGIEISKWNRRELGYSRSYATFLYSSSFLWVRFTAFFDSNGYFHEKRLARSRRGSIRSRSIGYLYHVHDIQFQQLATLLILASFRGLHESNRD